MKKYARTAVFILLIGLALSSFAFAISYFVSAWDTAVNRVAPRQISVQGEGKVAVRPDIAVFTAGVVIQAKKVVDAQAQNTRASNAVLAFLKRQGVDEKDIKAVEYSISPQYDFGEPRPLAVRRPPQIVGYEVRHTLEIRVRKLEQLDALLEGIVSQGANEVGSTRFSVDDEGKVKAEARRKAIEDAEKKARVLAKDLGVRLTRLTGFFESGTGPIPFFAAAEKGGFGGDVVPPAPEIAPGEQEIRSIATITYEFR